jgi:hypothetical protein
MLHHHIPVPSPQRSAALAALFALSAGALGGCRTTTASGPVSPPETASVTTSAWFPSSGAPKCVAGATWTYKLISVSGAKGSGDSIRVDAPTADFLPSNGRCVVSDSQPAGFRPGLRAGRWQISVLLGVASNSCEIDLHNGSNTVTFTYGISGCS